MSREGLHWARLDRSLRLQRVLAVLSDGEGHTTRDLIRQADVCAINSCVSELRANGLDIDCKPEGRGRFSYRLIKQEIE